MVEEPFPDVRKVVFKGSMNVTWTGARVLNAANSRRLSAVLFHTVWQTTAGSRGPTARVYHGSSNSKLIVMQPY